MGQVWAGSGEWPTMGLVNEEMRMGVGREVWNHAGLWGEVVEQGYFLRLPRWVGQEGRLVARSCWRARGWMWRAVRGDIGGE